MVRCLGTTLGLWLSATAGAAEPPRAVELDEAITLGVPAHHDAFADCNCVGLAWLSPEQRVLDLPASDVSEFRHVLGDGEPDRLILVSTAGHEMLLEQAPCVFIAEQASMYTQVLDRPLRIVDAAGTERDQACIDPLGRVYEWTEEKARQMAWTEVRDLSGGLLAKLEVSARGPDADVVSRAVRQEWAALRPRLGHCWSRELTPAPRSEARVLVQVSPDGIVDDVRLLKLTGSERVDECLGRVLDGAALSEPLAAGTRVRLDVLFGQ